MQKVKNKWETTCVYDFMYAIKHFKIILINIFEMLITNSSLKGYTVVM